MFQRTDIYEGMVVRSLDGEKLGKVFAMGDTRFQIEKGLFFPKDYLVSYSDIQDIRDGEIILARGRDGLREASDAAEVRDREPAIGTSGLPATPAAGLGATARTDLGLEGRGRDDARMELMDEVKRERSLRSDDIEDIPARTASPDRALDEPARSAGMPLEPNKKL